MRCKTASTFRQRKSVLFIVKAIFGVAMQRRKDHADLGKLDDYMLKDIGISRTDIERISKRTRSPRE